MDHSKTIKLSQKENNFFLLHRKFHYWKLKNKDKKKIQFLVFVYILVCSYFVNLTHLITADKEGSVLRNVVIK